MFGEYVPPSKVLTDEVNAYAERVRKHLVDAMEKVSVKTQPPELAAEVTKRVPPSARKNYTEIDDAGFLLLSEIYDLGSRIHNYQYIERYRSMVSKDTPKEIPAALTGHTYTLRSYEIYTVLERVVQLLKFARRIAEASGLPSILNDKKYESRMKKEFDYRLRERHRIVHAHERPSLVSRITSFGAQNADNEIVKDVLGGIAVVQGIALKLLKERYPDITMPNVTDPDFYRGYLDRVDQEAAKMWELLTIYLDECLSLPQPTTAPVSGN